jgi:hypothetical protein
MDCINKCGQHVLNPIVSELIEYHLNAAFLNKNRQKWSNRMKTFCSELCFKSPSAYRSLVKTFSLPSRMTIQRFMESGANNNPNEANVEQIFASDLETNDDLFVEQRIDSIEGENHESLQAVNEITLSIVSIDDNNADIQIIEQDINHDISDCNDEEMEESVSVRPNLTTQITAVPNFTPVMKTYTRTKQ